MKEKVTLTVVASLTTLVAVAGVAPATPIDGGLSWLLLAGGAFGVKKYLDHKKKRG